MRIFGQLPTHLHLCNLANSNLILILPRHMSSTPFNSHQKLTGVPLDAQNRVEVAGYVNEMCLVSEHLPLVGFPGGWGGNSESPRRYYRVRAPCKLLKIASVDFFREFGALGEALSNTGEGGAKGDHD
eukprot:g4294.t1